MIRKQHTYLVSVKHAHMAGVLIEIEVEILGKPDHKAAYWEAVRQLVALGLTKERLISGKSLLLSSKWVWK